MCVLELTIVSIAASICTLLPLDDGAAESNIAPPAHEQAALVQTNAPRPNNADGGEAKNGKVENSTAVAAQSTTEEPLAGVPSNAIEQVERFVNLHQPKLARLLELIKRRDESQFRTAIRDLNKPIQRIENLQQRDPELYELELELWKIRSQLRLTAAQMAVPSKDGGKSQMAVLAKLVERESREELKRLKLLRTRAAAEVVKFDEMIAKHQDSSEESVARALSNWENRIKRQSNRSDKAPPSQ